VIEFKPPSPLSEGMEKEKKKLNYNEDVKKNAKIGKLLKIKKMD
jgi:hypothetical protein